MQKAQKRLQKIEEIDGALDRRSQGDQSRDLARRSASAPREEGDGRGEPAARDLDREEVHESRPAVPRPDPGRQHRPHEGRRQVRVPPRLQILDVRDVVDSPGDHALDRRPSAHDPHPRAHDRDDQQAEPHLAANAAGDGPRADAGRARAAHGDARGQSSQGAQDRQGADLDGDADRRRRGLAPGRLHRGHRGVLADRLGDRRRLEGNDARRARRPHAARGESAAHALRHRHEHRPHARRSRQAVRRHARAHPADRGEGAAQAAPSVALRSAAQLPASTTNLVRRQGSTPGALSPLHRILP